MGRFRSVSLVIAQVSLSAAIVLTARWVPPDYRSIVAAVPGAALAIWAWLAIGLRKIRVLPKPDPDAQLVTSGPYAWIRHPMYTGLLLFTAALLPSAFAPWKILAWMALAAVLDIKARYEERLLQHHFDSYGKYVSHTARFVPKVY